MVSRFIAELCFSMMKHSLCAAVTSVQLLSMLRHLRIRVCVTSQYISMRITYHSFLNQEGVCWNSNEINLITLQ